ncbi:MAG TPA: class I SAM-dependent methyltransferase [Candidimonas sp.]|nr:class I SAM-dependent methyltransferase [Candidimonas sp.]
MHAQRSYPNEALIQFIASRYFARSITERQHIRVLELGCGSGANLWMLAKEGFDVYGLDSSSEALTLAMDHLSSKWGVTASVLQGSFTELPYNDGFFDVVVDVVSLQHLSLTDSSLALDEIVRVLRPGGEYFSYRLSDASVMFGDAKAIRVDSATLANIDDPGMPLANNGPVSFWSPSLARIMYSDAGLDLQGVERLGRTYSSGAFVEYLALAAVK